jgi:tryptophan-rich sensory protein
VLYVLIGLGGGVLWRLKDSVKKKMMQGLYILQVLLNWTWSPLFFHYHEIVSSLCVIGIMILLLLVLYYCIFENREKQWQLGLLFLPYLCWLFFACYLNGYIVFYN